MSITEKSGFEQFRRNLNSRLRALLTDSRNHSLYGETAPRFAERLWIPVNKIDQALKLGSSKKSGQVIYSWSDDASINLTDSPSIRACLAHWRDGIPWEETGIFDIMWKAIRKQGKVDRLRSKEDIKIRYAALDKIYEQVIESQCLKTRAELVKGNFREEGGILIHIGPDGRPFFGRKGNHRLAMAIAAEIPVIPAQLGLTHIDGIPSLPFYRTEMSAERKP